MSYSRLSTIRVGLFVLVMLLSIAGLMLWKSSVLIRANGNEVIGSFQNISGLLDGASVRYRGYKIGKVAKITPLPQEILVEFWVDPEIKIPKGSRLRIAFDGLIGEKYVEIIPNTQTSELIAPGEKLAGYSTRSLADFVDVGTQSLEESKAILASVRALVQQDDVTNAIKNSILSIEQITQNLSNMTAGFGSKQNQAQIQELISNLNSTSEALRIAIADKNAAGNLAKTAENLQLFSYQLKELTSDNGLKNEVMGSIQQGRSLLQQSDSLVSKLNQIRFSGDADVRYFGTQKTSAYNANAEIHNGPGFLRVGIGNRSGETQLTHFQPGIFISDQAAARIGMVNTKPGIGLDLFPLKRVKISADVYDVNTIKYDLQVNYRVMDNFSVFSGISPVPGNNSTEFNAGISIHPTPPSSNR